MPHMQISCVHILFLWGRGEEFREDVEGVEDLWRGKGGRGAERSTITAVVCIRGGAVA